MTNKMVPDLERRDYDFEYNFLVSCTYFNLVKNHRKIVITSRIFKSWYIKILNRLWGKYMLCSLTVLWALKGNNSCKTFDLRISQKCSIDLHCYFYKKQKKNKGKALMQKISINVYEYRHNAQLKGEHKLSMIKILHIDTR